MHFLVLMFWFFQGGIGLRHSGIIHASVHSLQAMDGGIFPSMKPTK
jgi:hypothetical protein